MKFYYKKWLVPLARKLRNNSTKSEILFWKQVRNKQFYGYDFHRQKPLGNYIVDFYCYKLRLVIEIDGWTHTLEYIYEKDLKKEEYLRSIGLTVIRFEDEEIFKDMDNVFAVLEAHKSWFEQKY